MDFTSILKVLERHRVRYVLFGTVGAVAYGADFSPGDLDICPALDEGNLLRLAGALEELDAKPKHNSSWNTREECDRWTPTPLAEETFDTIGSVAVEWALRVDTPRAVVAWYRET